MSITQNDPDGKEPLNELERKTLRHMIRQQDRLAWFWATLRIWTGWLVGAYALYEVLLKLFKKAGP